ncbi:MAG: hypothetical protein NTV34_21630 [Proteobacteria bacterium]|nr:hypothetical protein [Pseudomonadota bacterium]
MKQLLPIFMAVIFAQGCRERGDGRSALDQITGSSCSIGGRPSIKNTDILIKLLQAPGQCPKDVFGLHQKLKADGLTQKPAMVANRGFHNSTLGSFSFFETVEGISNGFGSTVKPGDFFFGHFTGVDSSGSISLDQEPSSGKLMIELIVWDDLKGFFNFYEMIGAGSVGQWFYRGDSSDILADVAQLHRQSDPAHPIFGTNLRCSGCHTNGGPIMKELSFPHNDWWLSDHKLPLEPNHPDNRVQEIMAKLVDASQFAGSVSTGQTKLMASAKFSGAIKALSLQERLRPLFCPVEVNISSDVHSIAENQADISVPSGFFINPLLAKQDLHLSRKAYTESLKILKSKFPETGALDADHAWLAPVKAESDLALVQAAIGAGLVDDEFVSDVLAVDVTNPVVSMQRCALLKFLPTSASIGWQEGFLRNLQSSATDGAKELALNFTAIERDKAFHQRTAEEFLSSCQTQLMQQDGVTNLARLLGQRRAEVFASEISKNPMGQILEPGFRVIFPLIQPAPQAQRLRLSSNCLAL